jgi:hypothetical protein
MSWSSTESSTLDLSPEDRRQIRSLGRDYRVYEWDMQRTTEASTKVLEGLPENDKPKV